MPQVATGNALAEALRLLGLNLPQSQGAPVALPTGPGDPGYDPTTLANRVAEPSVMDPMWLQMLRAGMNTAGRLGEGVKGMVTGGNEQPGASAENFGAIIAALGPVLGSIIKPRLFRAAADDIIVDTASFSPNREVAEAYLENVSNSGFGGAFASGGERRKMWSAKPHIKSEEVLDLYESNNPERELAKILGYDPGARHPTDVIHENVDALTKRGYRWARVSDSYPEGAETWIYLGGGDEPVMRRARKGQ